MKTQPQLIATEILLALALPAVLRADPLDHWHLRRPPQPTNTLNAVTYANGLFVAVGSSGNNGEILTSPDGVTWASHDPGQPNQLVAVAHGKGTFVALGTLSPQVNSATIIASSDATNWSDPIFLPGVTLDAVTCGHDVFVAVGHQDLNGLILTSGNTSNWTSQNVSRLYNSLAYGNGFFVAAGSDPILTSDDGITWRERTSAPQGEPRAVTYGNGLFVVLTGEPNFPNASVVASADTEQWTYRGGLSGVGWRGPGAYGAGTFALLGDGGRIARLDTNGMPAGQHNFQNTALRGLCYGRGTFVVVGDQGVILQSDPLPTARLTAGTLSGQGLPLTISGEEGLSYRLQAADELPSTNWTDLLTFTNSAPATNFLDTDATNFNRRFYRVVSP